MLKVIVANIFILRFVYITIQFYDPGSTLFSWHPTFMILGQLLILNGAFLMKHLPFKWRVTVHWILSGAGVTCFAVGFWAIYQNKINNNKVHFASWHGTLGVTLVVLLGIQLGGGVAVKYGSSFFKQNTKYVRFAHRLSGLACIVLSFVAVLLVTKESKAMYFGTVALPSALIIGTNLLPNKSQKIKSKLEQQVNQ